MPHQGGSCASAGDAYLWRAALRRRSRRRLLRPDCCLCQMIVLKHCSLETSDVDDRSAIAARDRVFWALVPHDNNLAVRSIAPAAGGAGARALLASIDPDLLLSNPYSHRACALRVRVELPEFLSGRGWRASAEPSEPITLPPGGDSNVQLEINAWGRLHSVGRSAHRLGAPAAHHLCRRIARSDR
jgi:hypothetical protein